MNALLSTLRILGGVGLGIAIIGAAWLVVLWGMWLAVWLAHVFLSVVLS